MRIRKIIGVLIRYDEISLTLSVFRGGKARNPGCYRSMLFGHVPITSLDPMTRLMYSVVVSDLV